MNNKARVSISSLWVGVLVACSSGDADKSSALDTVTTPSGTVSSSTTTPGASSVPQASPGATSAGAPGSATTPGAASTPNPGDQPMAATSGPATVNPEGVGGSVNVPSPSTADTGAEPAPTPSQTAAQPSGGAGGEPEMPPPAQAGGPGVEPMPEPTPMTREEPGVITSSEGSYWQVGELTEGTGNAAVTVNDTDEQQAWEGFGGTFNEMGWDALSVLSQEDRDRAIKLLFDYADGLALIFGRIPIGSSDYAMNRYSLNESANDYAMENFSIDRDREKLIPYIHAAQAVQPNLKFWGSPWSPPTWMKDNGAFDRGNMKNDAQTLGAHALYLARFVEEYATEGIDVSAIFPQNEAGFLQDYPSCGWSGQLMADYVGNHLGPLFEERGLTTEIWVGTLSNSDADNAIGKAVMGNAAAKAYVKGVGFQWGMIEHVGEYKSYGVRLWQTEHKCGNYPWLGGYKADKAPNDYAYAIESWGLLKDWINTGVNSYAAWNMVLDTIGRSLDTVRPWNQNAPLIVDRNAKQLIITPTYYVFRHIAQYVDPGAVRVSTQGGNAIAFKNPDGSIMLALYNEGGAGNVTVSVLGKSLQFMAPGRGWATVNVQPE